jgi:hypothetical protein
MIVLLTGLVALLLVVFGVEADVDVALLGFVFGKFLCRIAKAASFFFCLSISSGVSAASCFAERSEVNYHTSDGIQYISVYTLFHYA